MKLQATTVSTKGQIVIPSEIRETLGISAGTRVIFTVEGNRLVLQPVNEKLIDDTMGMFAGGPSMADELQRERRAEDKKW
jgi:AbrB family looped-hinge helix DNA binding protein